MLLYGASGHARVVKDCIVSSGGEVDAIFDDNQDLIQLDKIKVVGYYDPEFESDQSVVISIGDNLIRKKIASKIKHAFGKGIHKAATVSPSSEIGDGTVAMPGAIVNAGSTIGKHCILNSNSVVEHDCDLGDYVHISPNVTLCAEVSVGEGTHIGAGSIVIPGKSIGKWCVIGAGAVIIQDIPDYSMVVGVPGKIIRTLVKKAV